MLQRLPNLKNPRTVEAPCLFNDLGFFIYYLPGFRVKVFLVVLCSLLTRVDDWGVS